MSKFQLLFSSRRFWVSVAALAFVTAHEFGMEVSEECVRNVVLAAAAWVVGDSLRETK